MKKAIKHILFLFFLLALPLTTLAYGTGGGGSGGGGGGGGGGVSSSAPESTSNTATSVISSLVSTTTISDTTYTRPIELGSNVVKTDTVKKTTTAVLTGEKGSITMKPNSESTVSMTIPASTTATSTTAWDGKIDPPTIKSNTTILSTGAPITSSTKKLERKNVALVVKAGSDKASIKFDKKITVKVPVTGKVKDGVKVNIYYSLDGKTWTYLNNVEVKGGFVNIETDHLTYFAIEADGGVVTTATTAVGKTKFADIDSHWGKAYIEGLFAKGIVSGKSAIKFAPNDTITRAELTKMAVLAFGYTIPTATTSSFSDVSTSAWYAPYISVAKTNGIVSGVGGGKFAPNMSVNRAEALKILLEAAKTTGVSDYATKSSGFMDVKVAAWYNKYVGFAKAKSVVSGYSATKFAPEGKLTRAEASKMVSNVMGLK